MKNLGAGKMLADRLINKYNNASKDFIVLALPREGGMGVCIVVRDEYPIKEIRIVGYRLLRYLITDTKSLEDIINLNYKIFIM
ncbi:5378_t:CDS:2, partial [Entrophospora sp. SA101]